MDARFTAAHRSGSGTPMVCLHGFTDTWRTWELILPALQSRHDVVAPTLSGHAGGPPLEGVVSDDGLVDALERVMDKAGFATANLVGNSLGGYLALRLASRGRARTVVALAPSGGWARGDESYRDILALQAAMHERVKVAAPHAEEIVASRLGRRLATEYIATNFEHIPAELIAHVIRGVGACEATLPMIEYALREGWHLDAEKITCPVRIVWGTADRLLPWPATAARYRTDWLPNADWVVLDGVGHCPQLDVPLETAQLILGFAAD
ncbi:MAG: alpha/beta fold hydrolase [Solirubrobacteraceae bacterium]